MAKTVSINIEIETSKKDQAEAIFNNFGYSITDAIN
ncbi:type II toxin-antitoxin system antitoxin, RelB/DinJ family, partial [Streptococcus suis]